MLNLGRFGRFGINAAVKYDTCFSELDMRNAAVSEDLGMHGARLITKEPAGIHSVLFMIFHLPESVHNFRACAKVVWQRKKEDEEEGRVFFELGVEFCEISTEGKEVLHDYIFHHHRRELVEFWWKDLV